MNINFLTLIFSQTYMITYQLSVLFILNTANNNLLIKMITLKKEKIVNEQKIDMSLLAYVHIFI